VALADTARLATVLTLKDGLSPGLQKAGRNVGAFDKGMGKAGKSVGRMAGGVAKAGAVVTGFAVAGLGFAAKAAIEWEDAFAGVRKTMTASDTQFDQIADSIRKMSTEMPIAATELAAIAEAGGAMGIAADDIDEFTRTVALLGTTTNIAAEDAAMALGQLGTSMNLTADQYDNFASALVELGNKGNSTEAQILEIVKRGAAFAKMAGLNRKQTLAWGAAVANIFGDNMEAGGTAFAKFMSESQNIVSSGGKGLERFAKIAGQSASDFKKAFAKDASGALTDFLRGLKGLSKPERAEAIRKIFGKGTNLRRLIASLATGIDGPSGLNAALDNGTDAWNENTAAQEEFDKRNKTVRSAITRLKNGVTDAAISIGEGFAPALGRAADKLAAFLSQEKNRKKLEDFGKKIGDFIDGIDFAAATRSAEGLIDALKPAVGIIAKIAEAISKLPPELIGAGGALVITNKITGGVVLKGIEGAFEGVGGALAKSLAASIPIFGKAFVQPVFVTNKGWDTPGGGKDTPGTTGKGGKTPPRTGSGRTIAETTRTAGTRITDFAKKGGVITAASVVVRGDTVKGAPGGAMSTDAFIADLRKMLAQGRGNENVGNGETVVQALKRLTGTTVTESSLIRSAYDRANVSLKGAVDVSRHSAIAQSNRLQALQSKLHMAEQSGDSARVEKIRGKIEIVKGRIDAAKRAVDANKATVTARSQIETARLNAIREKQQAATNAFRSGERATGAKLNTANSRLAAIKNKRMSFSTSVNVAVRSSVSVRNVNNSNVTQNNYGSKTTNKVL
jgi:TP901 family phage tail tape measure protein